MASTTFNLDDELSSKVDPRETSAKIRLNKTHILPMISMERATVQLPSASAKTQCETASVV